MKINKNDLIDLVVQQVKRDILDGETHALELLLDNLDNRILESFLPEGYIDSRYLDDNADLFDNE